MDEVYLTWIGSDDALTLAPRKLTLKALTARAKISPKSFGNEMLNRLWAALFAYRRDLLREYQEFYLQDYSSFAVFLFRKHDLPIELIERIQRASPKASMLGLSAAGVGAGSGIVEWLKSENGIEALKKVARVRRFVDNEDSE